MKNCFSLDENNQVINTLIVNGDKSTEWLEKSFGNRWFVYKSGEKIQNGYKNHPAKGYFYHENLNAFLPPKPYESWTLNESLLNWEAPEPMPEDGKNYSWDEQNQSWLEEN